jgi:hypothetical protein
MRSNLDRSLRSNESKTAGTLLMLLSIAGMPSLSDTPSETMLGPAAFAEKNRIGKT